jgi:hypothetical protein
MIHINNLIFFFFFFFGEGGYVYKVIELFQKEYHASYSHETITTR